MFRQSTIKYEELKLVKELGRGGFGIVYQGTWRHNDVAVKKLLMENISAEAAQEFEKESQIMAQLRSPNIVQFYGFCVNPTYCLVMEYMPNGSLFSVLKSDKPLEWPVRFRIAIDIAKGLAFLHYENILHRDIKSLNVLLDNSYQAKLTDFGLSKVKTETKSHSMAMKTAKDSVGTLAWMAPELFEGRKAVYTAKSDIYSLGMTFWELASRKVPFSDAPNPNLIPVWVQKGDREDIPKDCPPALAALIQKCWVGVPEQRPDADTIVTELKTVELAINNNNEPKSPAHFNLPISSNPHYKGNFDSETPIKSEVPPKPLIFREQFGNLNLSPQNPKQVPVQIESLPKQPLKIDAKELSTFLNFVAAGQQDEAEEMLKKNKDLALGAGDMADHAKRTFKNITGFQYAVWALDWHMWKMIRKYLSDDAAREQVKGFTEGSWVKEHGEYVNWKNLLDAQQTYIDNHSKWWEYKKCEEYWVQHVGGAQLLLPMHVLQEYNQPNRPFAPCPNFKESVKLVRILPKWLEEEGVRQRKLGKTRSIVRSDSRDGCTMLHHNSYIIDNNILRNLASLVIDQSQVDLTPKYFVNDVRALAELSRTRTQQREELVAELTSDAKLVMRHRA